LMLTTEQFDIGDLIETNDIQGIVKTISLNNTRLKEFDGVDIIIPNSNIFGSTIVKFTHKEIKRPPVKKGTTKKERMRYRRYLETFTKILDIERKITRYTKGVQILGSLNPDELDTKLDIIFDKYTKIFGLKPSYCIDMTYFGRLKITLYVDSRNATSVLNNIDAFLRDLVLHLYHDIIYDGWEEYRKKNVKSIAPYEVSSE